MKPDFIHVKSPQMDQIARLASEAVISSSFLIIKGPLGSGRTHAGRMLARRWSNLQKGQKDESLTFPWRVVVFQCTALGDPKTRLESLIQLINPRQKISSHRIPHLIQALASALGSRPSLLYLNYAHLLSPGERLSILDAVQMARQNQAVGLAMSILEQQRAFDGILEDPRSLAEIHLQPLSDSEALFSMTFYDSRFQAWHEAYEKHDREAKELCAALSKHIDGNFDRLVQLWKSLDYHVKSDSLTLPDVLEVIAGRVP